MKLTLKHVLAVIAFVASGSCDQHLEWIGRTQDEHAANWHPQLWHEIAHRR
jgi:hypothetical protein